MTHLSGHSFRCVTLAALMASLCLGAAAPVAAQTTESRMKGLQLSNDQPIQIESDKLEIKDAESKATFSGNVKVTQGTTMLQAGDMTVYYKSGGANVSSGGADIDRIEVSNRVFLQSGTQQATADAGTFDMTKQTLVLSGAKNKVVLSEGKNVFEGCRLNVRMDTGEAQLEPCAGDRVKIQLDPKSRQQK